MLALQSLESRSLALCFSEKVTKLVFWLLHGLSTSFTQISPAEISAPAAERLVAAFLSEASLTVQLYSHSTIWNLQDSFGLMLKGTVYRSDLAKIAEQLQLWWRSVPAFAAVTVEVPTTAAYFTRTGFGCSCILLRCVFCIVLCRSGDRRACIR